MLFSLILYFPIWCTDPPKIGNFETEYIAGVLQTLTLNCEAEGNPPPTYTWTPCDPEQVCDKNTLDISQVFNDANYTCKVANIHGNDSKTASVCKLHYSLACGYYTLLASEMYQHNILIGFSEFNQGLGCQVVKSQNSAFTLSWWITLCFLYIITIYVYIIDYIITCKMQRKQCSNLNLRWLIQEWVSKIGKKTIVRASDKVQEKL